jgi:hypothetical protein
MSNIQQPNFGLGWSCVTDLTSPSIMVTGFRIVAEAIIRRWSTPRGGLLEDPAYGYDITDAVGDDIDQATLARMSQAAAEEAQKDERVRNCYVTMGMLSVGDGTGLLSVQARVETAAGPFILVAAVSQVTVTLLQVQATA